MQLKNLIVTTAMGGGMILRAAAFPRAPSCASSRRYLRSATCASSAVSPAARHHHLARQPSTGRSMATRKSNNDGDEDDDDDYVENPPPPPPPSPHLKYYSVSGVGRRGAATVETDTGHVLRTDVPRAMGGTDSAPQPVEHLLAALLGCTQATAVYVGRMMAPRLDIDELEFDVRAHRDERGALSRPIDVLPPVPARLQRVTGTVKVRLKGGKEERIVTEEELRILGEQTEARCPVANMMSASGCTMDLRWTIADRESTAS